MDISNDAAVLPFSIGPSTIIGRTIAFRVLFCKSISHLKDHIVRILLNLFYRSRNILAPLIPWLIPRSTHGMLALMAIVALFLKRYTNVKARAERACRRKFWGNMMTTALTYEEWAHAAKMLDKETPRLSEAHLYDEELVKSKLQELRHRRQEGSLRDITFFMRADLIRNLGNMCNPKLHKHRLHVPRLIKEYIDEVSTQLRMVCDSDSEELSLEEKLAFMHETRHAFGRTALLLSGGASLGAFHIGVVKTLVEHKLLPRIIAGSSVGSLICAIVATRTWPELQSFFEDSWHSFQFFDQMGGIFTVVKRLMTHGAVHEIRQLQIMLRHLTSNLTFQEAYDMTGRILGITVCSPRKHEPPRCLNYLTSPHVVIWSAVTASCAFPGLFEAQELMAKDRSGEIVPYHPPFNFGLEEGSTPVRRWRDGSLEIDLPMMQLKELFNVNHFIVSQANPHISPLLRLKEFFSAYGGNFASKLAHIAEMEVKHRCHQIVELGFPLGGLAKLFAQDWEGDVTVVMPATLSQYLKIIQNPTNVEIQKAANQGRRCTWGKLSAIKANCGIELALDECVAILNHMRRLKRSAQRAAASSHGLASTVKFSASKRIPSWNCIARESSTGSFDDEVLADVASSFHLGITGSTGAGPSNNAETNSWTISGGPLMRTSSANAPIVTSSANGHIRSHRNLVDGCDSDSENAETNSWTISGGPLMRTSSADQLIDFVQNLDYDTELNRGLVPHQTSFNAVPMPANRQRHSTRGPTPDGTDVDKKEFGLKVIMKGSSITITESDLLQPERMQNGIVFSVVKKGDLTMSNKSLDSENDNVVAESLRLERPGKETDANSGSECGEEDVSATKAPAELPDLISHSCEEPKN